MNRALIIVIIAALVGAVCVFCGRDKPSSEDTSAFRYGKDIALTPIPGVTALFASQTSIEQACLLADAQDAAAFSERQENIGQWNMIVGRVVVAETTHYVDDPVIFYNDARTLDGRSLAHIEAPFFEVVPGRFLIEAGTLLATSLHGGALPSVSCPCSTGGTSRHVGCEIEPPGFNPDPCGNPYASPSSDRLVGGLTYCPAMSTERSDFGGVLGGCRSSCLVMGSLAECAPDQSTVPPLPPFGDRGDCTVRSVVIDELCTQVMGGSIGACPGYCEGHASDVCGSLFASDGELPRDATCGIMTNAIAIAGPDSECVENPLDTGTDALAQGRLSLRESWTLCLATPRSPECAGRRVPLAPPDGEFGSLVDTTEVTLATCLQDENGLCALCSQEGLGKGCLPVVDIRSEVTEVAVVPRGGMHGAKVDHEGRAAAMSRLAMRLRGPDPRVADDDLDVDLAEPAATPDNASDPVSLATGELLLEAEDFSFPSRGVELALMRHYRSGGARSGAFGPGWTHVYEERIEPIGDPDNRANMPKYCVAALPVIHCLLHHDGRGGSHLYVLDERNHVFVPSPGAFGTIAVWMRGAPEAIGAGPVYRLREPDGSVKIFDWLSGLLLKTVDEKGFGVTLEYELLSAKEVEEQGSPFDVGPTDIRPRSPVSFAAKSAHRDRVNRINRLKLVRLKDAFGRHIRLDYDTYQLHVRPTSAPNSPARRRRLVSATYENPPRGPEELLVTWDYVENNLTNEAYLSRATRLGMTQALLPARPLVTDYDYAHELFESGFAYGMSAGAFTAPLGQEVAVLFDHMSRITSTCAKATPTVSASFPELADPLCGQRWRVEDQPIAIYVNDGALMMDMLRQMLADNIVRVWRGDTETQTIELESLFEIDPRRPEFDRVTQQRFGMLPAPLARPEPVKREGSVVHQWHTSMPATFIYGIEGKLVPDAKIPFVHHQEGEIDNPRAQASFVLNGRTVPTALLDVLPLVTHGPSPAEIPGALAEPLCMDLTKQTPAFEVVKPAGDRASFTSTDAPTLARTEQTCAAIAARWSRDAFTSDLVDPLLFVKELANIPRFGLRRELLAWDMNLACQFVQVVDRRNISTTYALNFLGQPVAIAAPAPDDSVAITTWSYTADGLVSEVTQADGGRIEYARVRESEALHAPGTTLSRANITAETEYAATASHLVPGSEQVLRSRSTGFQYDPLYQQVQRVTHPDTTNEHIIFDYQQLSFTSVQAQRLAMQFTRQTGAILPASAFLNADYDGDGTSAGETSRGAVVRYASNVATGQSSVTVGLRTRRDETGRVTRTTRIASPIATANDAARVDYLYYPDIATSQVAGARIDPSCNCPRGPLAKTIAYRTPTSSAPNDRDEHVMTYDALGGLRLTQDNDHHESDIVVTRDSLGRVTEIESPGSPHRLTTSYGYDARGHLASTTQASADIETQVHTTPRAMTGELLGRCTEHGAGACAGFAAFAVLATQKHRFGSTIPTFTSNASWQAMLYDIDDELGRLVDAEGGETQFIRNEAGFVVEERTEASPPYRNTYLYDVMGRLKTSRTGAGGEPLLAVHHQFDRLGRLVARQTRASPKAAGFVAGQGTIERWVYDSNDRVARASITGAAPDGRRLLSLSRIIRNTLGTPLLLHEYAGTLLSIEDPISVLAPSVASSTDSWLTSFQHIDNQQRPVTVGHEGLTPTTVSWNDFGPTSINSATHRLSVQIIPRLREDTVLSTAKGEGGIANAPFVSRTTHRAGNALPTQVSMTSNEDGLARVRHITHDALGRLTSDVGPDGRGVALEYDPAGRIVARRETHDGATVRTTTFTHDLLGRVTAVMPAGAPHVSLSYDRAGALMKRASGTVSMTYSHDAARRLLRQERRIGPAVRTTDYAYSEGQLVPKEIAVDGVVALNFSHDGLDRVVTAEDKNVVLPPDSSIPTFRASRPSIRTTRVYDSLGRVASESSTGTFPSQSPILPSAANHVLSSLTFQHPSSALGPTSIAVPGDESVNFAYFGSGAVAKMERSKGASKLSTLFGYQGGLWTSVAVGGQSMTRQRDAFGNINATILNGTNIRSDVLRGATGRIVAERRATVRLTGQGTSGSSLRYDGLGRFSQAHIDRNTSVSLASFESMRPDVVTSEHATPFATFDAVQSMSYSDADAVLAQSADDEGRTHVAVVENDTDGVPTEMANGAPVSYDAFRRVAGTQDLTLTYDVFDRLVLVMRSDQEEQRITYDGLGRRVLERSRIDGSVFDRTLVYLDGNVIQEMNTASNTVVESVMHAPGLDAPIAHINGPMEPGFVAQALLTNARGDVIASRRLSDGVVTQEAHYDAYGERRISLNTTECVEGTEFNGTASKPVGSDCAQGLLGRFGIAGGRAHAGTKFVDMRNRVYAPHLKGFLTKDPLGPIDSYALYSYAAGDPVNLRDPLGLSVIDFGLVGETVVREQKEPKQPAFNCAEDSGGDSCRRKLEFIIIGQLQKDLLAGEAERQAALLPQAGSDQQTKPSLGQRAKNSVRATWNGVMNAWDVVVDALSPGPWLVDRSIGLRRYDILGIAPVNTGMIDEPNILDKSRDATGAAILAVAPALVGRLGKTGASASAGGPKLLGPGTNIGAKIRKQMAGRGWNREAIERLIANPHSTRAVRDMRHLPGGAMVDDPATAFINRQGHYVIRNNRTGDIVQVSNRHDLDWVAPWN